MSKTCYAVRIIGSNASSPWCRIKTDSGDLRVSTALQWGPEELGIPRGYLTTVRDESDPLTAQLVVFDLYEAASVAGRAARWNNQQYSVEALGRVPGWREVAGLLRRGETTPAIRLVMGMVEVTGDCQSVWSESHRSAC